MAPLWGIQFKKIRACGAVRKVKKLKKIMGGGEFWVSEFWDSEFWDSEFWVSEFWVSEF